MMAHNPMDSRRRYATLIAVLVVFFVALTCFYQVHENEAAVLTTFEKPVSTVERAGLHLKWPWPIQKVYPFDKRVRLFYSPYDECLLKDGFSIGVRLFVAWSIRDVSAYKQKVGVTVGSGERLVATLLARHLKGILGSYAMSDLVSVTGSSEGERDGLRAVEESIQDRMTADSESSYGIVVNVVGFDRLELPEDTTAAVFERMKAERMKAVESILSEGKYRATAIRKDADAARYRLVAEAEAEATKIRGDADAKAFEYLDVYSKHPDFALFLKKLQTLENTMKSKTTIVIDDETSPFDLLSAEGAKLPAAAASRKD